MPSIQPFIMMKKLHPIINFTDKAKFLIFIKRHTKRESNDFRIVLRVEIRLDDRCCCTYQFSILINIKLNIVYTRWDNIILYTKFIL